MAEPTENWRETGGVPSIAGFAKVSMIDVQTSRAFMAKLNHDYESEDHMGLYN